MASPDDSADKPPARPPHRFPKGLEFLDSLRKALQAEDYQMRMAILITLLENVRSRTELLRAHGLDPDKMETMINDLVRSDKEVEEAQEHLLQLMANKVDATRAYVDAFETFVKAAAEERPFDPQVEDALEVLEQFRKVYPKID